MINKKGFTLAEVLITIGILGVIAAVTLPALNTNLSKSQLEVQTRKFYTQFSKALDLYKVDNETDTITEILEKSSQSSSNSDKDKNSQTTPAQDFIKQYFKVAKRCSTKTECYAEYYPSLEGSAYADVSDWFNKDYTYQLEDGSVFTLTLSSSTRGTLTFDVNGKKGPNKIGYDLWQTHIHDDGTVDYMPTATKESKTPEEIKQLIETKFQACLKGTELRGCFAHFKQNDFKFDY